MPYQSSVAFRSCDFFRAKRKGLVTTQNFDFEEARKPFLACAYPCTFRGDVGKISSSRLLISVTLRAEEAYFEI